MFRPAADILKPDPRHESEVLHNQSTGRTRNATIADWHALIDGVGLGPSVPQRVCDEFDKARNAFLYSWFSYELATLAEHQSFATLEMALREKLTERDPAFSAPRGLKKLLNSAKERGLLTEGDLTLPGIEPLTLIDFLPMQRNKIANGSDYLFPQASLKTIELCADLINALWCQRATCSDPYAPKSF